MDLKALKTELLAGHPATGAYSADATVAAAQINAGNRTRNKTSLSGATLLESTDAAEYAALTPAKQSHWLSLCGVESINPRNGGIRRIVSEIWGIASITVDNLSTSRVELISRSEELGIGRVLASNIIEARRR